MDEIKTYSNPFELADEWPDYGNGDPYVYRYNGTYYLYVSTKDRRVGIKAWSSTDLVNWTYEGLVTEDELTTTAYAPEVIYWNGNFYMYTSPSGDGHYVLSSKSPTGPFKVETENLGMSIDGSVFIDDDGSWYFTHSGHDGIVGRRMTDPFTFEHGVNTNAYLGHWTEGSMIIKNNDLYYMTYTGNHVFSDGYRINYAVSEESPLTGYEVPEHNPILISTKSDFKGLGHNSLVRGPNLDSYYIVYHNLIGRSAEGPPVRKMNIDRLVFNGKKLDVLGPTNYSTPVPDLPDYEERWDENKELDQTWFSELETEENYTAEFNFKIPEQSNHAEIATVFSYEDDQHYGAVSIDIEKNEMNLLQVMAGTSEVLATADFPEEFDFTYLHTIRVENRTHETIVFIDGMKKIIVEDTDFGSGKIGYQSDHVKTILGYTAFSNHVDHSSDYELYKPLPGTIEATHYLEGENRGYYIKNPVTDRIRRENVPIQLREDGSYSVQLKDKGDWLKYKINAEETGLYEVSAVINPHSIKNNITLDVAVDDDKPHTFKYLKKNMDTEQNVQKIRLGRITIEEGFHTLQLLLKRGEVEIDYLDIYRVSDDEIDIKNGMKKVEFEGIHGSWKQHEEGLVSNKDEDMKIYMGDEKWTDVEAELTFEINDKLMNQAGILLRANYESHFEHQVNDALIGYYVSFQMDNISIKKLNYDSTLLLTESITLEAGEEHHLRVTVQENEIKVYIDHEKDPIISYKDPQVFSTGKLGLRSEYSDVHFKNFTIQSIQ